MHITVLAHNTIPLKTLSTTLNEKTWNQINLSQQFPLKVPPYWPTHAAVCISTEVHYRVSKVVAHHKKTNYTMKVYVNE